MRDIEPDSQAGKQGGCGPSALVSGDRDIGAGDPRVGGLETGHLSWVGGRSQVLAAPEGPPQPERGNPADPSPPGNEAEQQDLSTALVLVKDLLSAIDQEVHDSAKSARLREIHGRLDGRARVLLAWEGRNAAFGRDELLRRRLVHDGSLLWKMATGRFKGAQGVKAGGQGATQGHSLVALHLCASPGPGGKQFGGNLDFDP